MIQRIQTVFLLFVIVVQIVLFFTPLAIFISDLSYYKLFLTEMKNMTPDSSMDMSRMIAMPLTIMNSVIIIIAGITIFKFKNRVLQLRLNRFNILLIVILVVGILFGYPQWMMDNAGSVVTYEYGAYLPLISIVFLFLANIYTGKDEKLVRSADRLR